MPENRNDNKIDCPVCGKRISEKMGRKVHENSAFHQAALNKNNQSAAGAEDAIEVKDPVVVASQTVVKDPEPNTDSKSDSNKGSDAIQSKSFLDSFFDWLNS